jgi:putative peptidoglycan lipid II flippase
MGAGFVSDCFFVAFKLPNFFRRLFAEGAFSAAFVPLLGERLEADGEEAARRFVDDAFAVLLAALLALLAVMQVIMPWAMIVLAPGFSDDPPKFDLAVTLTRITFPYLLLVSLVSLLGGVLNSFGRFAAVAGTPILLNLSMIGCLWLLRPVLPTAGHAAAIGVTLGGVLQLAWLIVECRRLGVAPRLRWPRLSPGVKILLKRMGPGVIGAGAVQINLMVDVILASLLPSGALSFLFYADRLNQLPLGVIGIAVGTAILPLLSRQLAAGNTQAAMANHNRAVEVALLLTVPAAAALIAVPGPLIAGLFQRGAFTAADTLATAHALVAFALGLPAYVLIKVLVPGFFARGNTKTPVQFAMIALACNFGLNLALIIPLQHVGLALATAIAAWVNALLLLARLVRDGQFVFDARLKRRLPRILATSALTGGGLYAAARGLAPVLGADAAGRIALTACLVALGLALFAGLGRLLGAYAPSDLKGLVRRGG